MTYLQNDLQKRARKLKQQQKLLVLSKAGGVAVAAFLVFGLANMHDVGVKKPQTVSLPPAEVVELPKTEQPILPKRPILPKQPESKEPTIQKTNPPTKITPKETSKARTEQVDNNKMNTEPISQTPTGESQMRQPVSPPVSPPVRPPNIPAPVWTHFQKLAGENLNEYQVHPSLSNEKTGQYYFTRMVNGIPYLDSGYLVQVQGEKTQSLALSGNKQWNTQLFTDPAKAIPMGQAQQAFADSVELAYVGNQSKLVYFPRLFGNINALDGTIRKEEQKQLIPITPHGKQYVRDEKEAAAFLSKELQLPMNELAFQYDSSNNNGMRPQNITVYQWFSANRQKSISMDVITDTGQIVSYNFNGAEESSKNKPDPKPTEAYIESASLFLQKFLDKSVQQLRIKDIIRNSSRSEITIQFQAMHHDIAIIDRTFEISIDLETEQVVSMDGDLTTSTDTLPEPVNVILRETAIKRLLEEDPLELVYANTPELSGANQPPQLIYTIINKETTRTGIDANTGKKVIW
ncbi:YcdB/YcdC domain-containing protein [Brevibacillus porteri]|uniref:YcdB/YcdC domain-containing protein n=1 Tax=Brevibacillus porteri TaxID=2126350 RepID=UPI003D1BFAFA